MYTTTRFFYPHGIEGEEMDNTIKEFDTIEKAVKYAHRYSVGVRFAGVQIEDENGKLIYEITAGNDAYDYREEFKKQIIEKAKKENGFFMNTDNIRYDLDGRGMAEYLKSIGFNIIRYFDAGRNGLVLTQEGVQVSTNGHCSIIK
jgi:hypothetical protein